MPEICTVTKANRKLQQLNPGRLIHSLDPSRVKALVTPPGKGPRGPEVLVEDEGLENGCRR